MGLPTKLSITLVFALGFLMVHSSLAQNSPQDYLNAHNAARAAVNVGPMQWDETVANYARNYANQRSGDCALQHSNSGGKYGENLFEGGGGGFVFNAKDAVDSWVGEKQYYDYGSNSCAQGQQCGHYTQVVWRDSVRLGCARVQCRNNGWWFITCNYSPPGGVSSTTVTLLNRCNQTVWPGIKSNSTIEVPITRFRLGKGENTTIKIPSSWTGRFYARTQCVEDAFGNFTCLTGDCGSGRLECTGSRSVAAATLAEFTTKVSGGKDFFHISMVDGYNLPIMIDPIGGLNCSRTECMMDVNGVCPSQLKISSDGEGVACKSACTAFRDPQYCCTGAYNSPAKCKATNYSNVFKNACPSAYSYIYDNEGSAFTCDASNYLVSFCPTPNESNDNTRKSGGGCDRDSGTDPKCLSKPGNNTKPPGPGKTMGLGLKIGIAGGVALCILFLLLLLFICHRQIKTRHNSSYPKDVEVFIRKYGPSAPKRFRYSTLKKITNSFKEELGKGGYGNVYKGKLPDGCVVAVKVLKLTKGNGEEFMNEVASIGRTSHVNVVSLLGFVYEGKKRALIYEFMLNGSLEKFIHATIPSLKGQYLSWEKLYNIALGIARGLEYLHCGCTTQILHFDIKPHNILLDEDFCPKISDFGLAKLYTRKESVLSSIMQARGTIGYIAPEVVSRNFGPVSHKSDVYSYGMMILEMVGGRKNVDTTVAHTSEIYFPRWVYKHIHDNEDIHSANNITEEENHIVRKMMIVGLWCIQTNPSQRPSISKVIEMFEGNLATLEIPPKPYMCSPPTSPAGPQQKTRSRSSSLIDSKSSP